MVLWLEVKDTEPLTAELAVSQKSHSLSTGVSPTKFPHYKQIKAAKFAGKWRLGRHSTIKV